MSEEVSGGVVEVAQEAAPTSTEQQEQEVVLPSDQVEFQMPEKFAGKSAEDIAKSYMELEKFKASKEEVPKEEAEAPKETPKADVSDEEAATLREAMFSKEGLNEEQYSKLEKLGYSKEEVDDKIGYEQYKQQKQMQSVLEPLGGGEEKFQAVVEWANEAIGEEALVSLNKELEAASPRAQQALLRELYAQFDSQGTVDNTIHTNTPQAQPSKGYTTQEEFFKDVGSPEYETNKTFREKVEAKMAKSNIF